MNDEQNPTVDESEMVTPKERRKVWLWAAAIVVLFVIGTVFTSLIVYRNKADAAQRHKDRMNPEKGEGGTRPPAAALPPGANPVRVRAGMYLDRITELSVKETKWTGDFYLWFRWTGSTVNPGENFLIVDGAIESKEKVDEYTSGDERYVLYRVVATTTKFFDVARFPRDDHILTISIESPAADRQALLFVPDTDSSAVSSRVRIPGYEVYRQLIVEKPHAYRSTHGNPRLAAGAERVHSQLRMGFWIRREGLGFYFKLFVALFVAVGIALLAFFIKPTDVDPRFGLGLGALAAVIVNTYVTSSLVPDTGVMTLADMLNQIAIVTIFISLAQSAISLYLYDRKDRKALSRLFDRVSFLTILPAYVVINLILPWAATS